MIVVNTRVFRSCAATRPFCHQKIENAKQEARDSFDSDNDFEITDKMAPKTAVDMVEKDD